MLLGHRSGFYADTELGVALHLIAEAGASVMSLVDYGLEVGNEATFLVLRRRTRRRRWPVSRASAAFAPGRVEPGAHARLVGGGRRRRGVAADL
jgi:cytosine/adenosine deaminase-related metal-dependent hydrolase